MPDKRFSGSINFEALSMADVARAAGALAVLEEICQKEGFAFSMSVAKRAFAPRADVNVKRSAKRPRLQLEVMRVLLEGGPMMFADIRSVSGLKEGSINPHLSALRKEGLVEKTRIAVSGGRGRPGHGEMLYTLTEAGRFAAAEAVGDAVKDGDEA
ncbi:PadR family transcriptional regulator [Rhizobium leguminosarum]|uniref:PadR family transcriptional regulator n=1 Tax=Rhizobium leguminosarum TaxID=384 RepID=UPI002E15650B|nr:ArsR family transcriptional regulator [Rhizobium leguminosarum]WSH77107.1 ArsR family transcriptional regulator [Rhizobium leguminosarum]